MTTPQEMKAAIERRRLEERSAAESSTPAEITSEFIWECFQANEVGDSMLYNTINRGKYLHNSSTKGEWLIFEHHSWKLDRTSRALAAVEDVALLYLEEAARKEQEIREAKAAEKNKETIAALQGMKSALEKRASKLRSVSGRDNCLKCAATNMDPLTTNYDELDQDPWLLGVKNGVIDLRSGLLREGRPGDLITRACQVEFNGIDEECPAFLKFLQESLADDDIIRYLQKLIGYSMTGLTTLRIFPVFYGMRGQNGKGTLLEILFHLLGPLSGPIQSEMLTATRNTKSSSGPSPDIMDLKGKRLVWASETEEGQRFAVAKVKLYTGGDPLVGRNPNDRHQTTFYPSHTLFLLTNNKPHAPANDNAFWIRQKLIEFPFSFVDDPEEEWEKKAVPGLIEFLKAETAGILAFFIRGCLLWQKEGLKTPDKVKQATAQYRRDEDQIADFVAQCCVLDPNYQTGATALYEAFKIWWKDNVNPKPLSQRKFGDLMTMRFHKAQPKGTVVYYGVALQSDYNG
ncbi:MAG: phage/plasmid primase, P4 family [Desulfobulbales bacterium]|nr:phage/plasmid primase, P4 family [Desulfobulbales bacterium]